MSDYELLCQRIGKKAADRLVRFGLNLDVDRAADHNPTAETPYGPPNASQLQISREKTTLSCHSEQNRGKEAGRHNMIAPCPPAHRRQLHKAELIPGQLTSANLNMEWNALAAEFRKLLSVDPPLDSAFRQRVENILARLHGRSPVSANERRTRLFALVNNKFDINASSINEVLAIAASKKIPFNYHDKKRICAAFDRADQSAFTEVLKQHKISDMGVWNAFRPVSTDVTLKVLHDEIASPTLVRKDSRPRDWSEEIRRSLFGGFVFSAFSQKDMHELFDGYLYPGTKYEPNFWRHLHKSQNSLFSRTKALVYFEVRGSVPVDVIASALEKEFRELANHGFFALHLSSAQGQAWRTAALATLFAEKFIHKRIEKPYFHWQEIEAATRSYIPTLNIKDPEFEIGNVGYHFKDTYVIGEDGSSGLLLLFQKNISDETPIPCPSCRSHEIQGNSYSSLGVKSWECNNPICPDRSKFDRGKRYSFLQLLRQEAIENPAASIPTSSVRSWSRDVQSSKSSEAIIEMLIRHFTLPGDGILQVGGPDHIPSHGRNITHTNASAYIGSLDNTEGAISRFRSSSFFKRFATTRVPDLNSRRVVERRECGDVELLMGDCFDILANFPDCVFDGAVTSPPYYNAREYAQWANIYCYLYDMYNIAREVFRTLKPGATYLFNIFDYFDNENIIVSSAMGDKRMILSAYCVELFEHAGFQCEGNIVWDKGEIEGKRAFNNGNYSPYYQAPFNCWEHILIFKKPGQGVQINAPFPSLLRQKPVIKMVRGINRHGHSAPFPDQIPALLLERLGPGALVLDPFAGSMTTGRVAARLNRKAVCIENNREYFELGYSLLKESAVPLLKFNNCLHV
jgi:DNA modification methylase